MVTGLAWIRFLRPSHFLEYLEHHYDFIVSRQVIFKCKSMVSNRRSAQVDYSKLAENMEWFTKDDATKPNVKKANNAWLVTRKKLFPDGMPAAAAPEGGAAAKAKAPATPRTVKEPNAPKTPRGKKAAAKKGEEEVEDDEEEAGTERAPSINGVHRNTGAIGSAKATDSETDETSDANLKKGDNFAVSEKNSSVADGNIPTRDSNAGKPTEHNPSTPIAKTSVAGEMSSGSMSPTAPSAKTNAAPATPKAKDTPKTQKNPNTGSTVSAAKAPLPDTPATTVPKATPKKRKTKAEKEAEATTADEEGGAKSDADGKPPAKKRKSIDGKAVAQTDGDEEAANGDSDDGESAKPTPVKTPRKPSAAQLAKREEKEREKAAKKAEKEKEKAEKKAEKEREKAEKKVAKKAARAPANADANGKKESPKPKMPRKPSAAQQAKKGEKEEAEKASQGAEDRATADAETTSLALVAQEEINKKTNDVFNGARIDKPASVAAEENAETEVTTGDDDASKASGFIAINSNAGHAGSTAASETVKSTVEASEEDGETMAVVQEKVTAVGIEAGNDTVVVAEGA
jgi:hypothetical protein